MGGAVAAAVVGTVVHETHKAKHAERKAQRQQNAILEEQRKILEEQQSDALAKRKEQIDQQREQIIGGSYQTNKTSTTGISSGIRGTLG